MKYILMMTGTKAGVDGYRAWSQSDIQAHFAFLKSLNNDLSEAGELVANEGLAAPEQAKVGPSREGRRAYHGRGLSGSQGISAGLLDR